MAKNQPKKYAKTLGKIQDHLQNYEDGIVSDEEALRKILYELCEVGGLLAIPVEN